MICCGATNSCCIATIGYTISQFVGQPLDPDAARSLRNEGSPAMLDVKAQSQLAEATADMMRACALATARAASASVFQGMSFWSWMLRTVGGTSGAVSPSKPGRHWAAPARARHRAQQPQARRAAHGPGLFQLSVMRAGTRSRRSSSADATPAAARVANRRSWPTSSSSPAWRDSRASASRSWERSRCIRRSWPCRQPQPVPCTPTLFVAACAGAFRLR